MPTIDFPIVHYVSFSFKGTHQFVFASTTDPRKPKILGMKAVDRRGGDNGHQIKYHWSELDKVRHGDARAVQKLFRHLSRRQWYVNPQLMNFFRQRFGI